jgi:glycosyltransferase involved in cell wall biosynthesis
MTSLDYLLFSGSKIPPTITYECKNCGERRHGKDTDALREQECKQCNGKVKIVEPLVLSGLYCWVSAFRDAGGKGVMNARMNKEYMEQFDLIGINYTPGHPTYIQAIRELLGKSDTKIIANVDYAVSMWGNMNPLVMKKQLEMADMVFHVESTGARTLTSLLGDTFVSCIPHPVDVDRIKKFIVQPHDPPTITCQWHRYRGTWDSYYYGLKDIDAARVLVNFYGEPPITDLEVMFDQIMPATEYTEYLKNILAPAAINVDMAPDLTYGRGVVDAAALGVPTVGSNTIEAMNRIWPELVTPPHDYYETKALTTKLLTDKGFGGRMSVVGQERAKFYNTENSYKRMKEALEERKLI